MTTLITGATGFIGGRLLQPGDRLLVRQTATQPGRVAGDLLNPASLVRACEGVETVIHCAGNAQAVASSDSEMHARINFEGTRNLLEAARRCGVSRFVFLSSVKAMAEPGAVRVDEDWPGEPCTGYGRAKRAAEDLVLEAGARHGMQVTNLRLAMVYGRGGRGNLERMVRGIQAGWFPPLPETGNKRSLVHIDDVVEAIRLVASRPEANGRTYIVADAQAYSGREIYDAIRQSLEMPAVSWRLPLKLLKAGAKVGDIVENLLGRTLPLNSEAVERLLGAACYSPARIERELGWRSRVGLAEGLLEMMGCD